MPIFDFAQELKATNSIDIDNIGNFYLEAINEDDGFCYYLSVKTTLGTSSILYYGPVVPDLDILPDNYSVIFQRLPFNDKKMFFWVNKWLNDHSRKITTATLIDENEFFTEYKDLKSYMEKYSDEVY